MPLKLSLGIMVASRSGQGSRLARDKDRVSPGIRVASRSVRRSCTARCEKLVSLGSHTLIRPSVPVPLARAETFCRNLLDNSNSRGIYSSEWIKEVSKTEPILTSCNVDGKVLEISDCMDAGKTKKEKVLVKKA